MDILSKSKPIDCETFIKNAHLYTKMHIFNNQQLILLMQPGVMSTSAAFNRSSINSSTPFITRYSLQNMSLGHPSLIDIIQVKYFGGSDVQILDQATKAYVKQQVGNFMGYQVPIKKKANKQQQPSIQTQNKEKHNPLHNPQYFKNRLEYLTTKHTQIKQSHINQQGDLLVLSLDGRAVYLKRVSKEQRSYQTEILINQLCQFQKIITMCFMKGTNDVSIVAVTTKDVVFLSFQPVDFQKKSVKKCSFKLTQQKISISQIEAFQLNSSQPVPPLSLLQNVVKEETMVKLFMKIQNEIYIFDLKIQQRQVFQRSSKNQKKSKAKKNSILKSKSEASIPQKLSHLQITVQCMSNKLIKTENNQFIDKFFVFGNQSKTSPSIIYFSTFSGLFKAQLNEMISQAKMMIKKSNITQRIQSVNQNGDFLIANRPLFTEKDYEDLQSIELNTINAQKICLCSRTSNGVVYCLTTHFQGNYKQGRIVKYIPDSKVLLRNCFLNIKKLNIKRTRGKNHAKLEMKMLQSFESNQRKRSRSRSRQKKELNHDQPTENLVAAQPVDLTDFNYIKNSQKRQNIKDLFYPILKKYHHQYKNFLSKRTEASQNFLFKIEDLGFADQFFLTSKQMQVILINLASFIDLKSQTKEKYIKKAIKNHFVGLQIPQLGSFQGKNEHQSEQILEKLLKRCIYSGRKIVNEQIRQCKNCKLYAIQDYLHDICYICWKRLEKI